MLYKDIIKQLAEDNEIELQELAERLDMKPNTLYQRLKESRNPRVKDMMPILEALGYEIAFVPIGEVGRNKGLQKKGFIPEFPDKPARTFEKKSDAR